MIKILTILVLMLTGSAIATEANEQDQNNVSPHGPNLGQAATPEEVAALSINVFPDGRGLPEGEGDVVKGAELYQAKCMVCHGPNGLGGSAEPLVAGEMGLTGEYPEKTIGTYWPYATTLFDFTRRSMPMTAPGTLTNNETYALTAYLLYINNIVKEDIVLNKESLMQIEMPNVDGFINVYEKNVEEKQK